MGLLMHKGKSYGGGLTRLLDMLDVNISNPSNGELLQYNSANQKYENSADVWKTMSKNGAHNLLPKPVSSETINGATFTVMSDGSVNVDTNNLPTSGVANYVWQFPNLINKLGANTYRLTGCPSGGSASTYFVNLYVDNGWQEATKDYGDGSVFTANTVISQANISIRSGVTINNLRFYPMLRLASDTDPTYAPYAKTNRELTEELGFGAVGASLVSTYVDTSADSSIGLRKWGHVCILMMQIKTTSSLALNTQQTIATIPSGYIPKYGTFDITFDKGYDHTNESHDIEIDTNGAIKLTLRNTHNNTRWVCATMTYICE